MVCEKGILRKLKDVVRQAAKFLRENIKFKEKFLELNRSAAQDKSANIETDSDEWDERR